MRAKLPQKHSPSRPAEDPSGVERSIRTNGRHPVVVPERGVYLVIELVEYMLWVQTTGEEAMRAGDPISQGFTLIELMIVVVVIGILAVLAYPSFVSHLIRTDRADAREAIARVQLAQERYRAREGEYADVLDDLAPWGWTGDESQKGYYVIDIPVGTATRHGFTVSATAKTGTRQANDRVICRELTLTVTPSREIRGPDECW
jgi:type IV pilus assembly protein PilE